MPSTSSSSPSPSLGAIRREFLDFFAEKGHRVVASAPLLPQNDPSLLFVNAGMVPFKPLFLGKEKRDYARAASSQKCVRAGGKHNDLDNVGYTARHHTFFEMLGNFSFADYFKEDAVRFAWELLTKNFGLPKEKLCVTVYHTDDEARALWKKVSGLTDDKIISISTNDNFWAMGDTGPCGPCSEIFYDRGDNVFGGPPGSADQDGDRFTEIWNLVFMQFERSEDGALTPLPSPCIDTGMGLERIAGVMQGVDDNYAVDLFADLIHSYENVIGARAEGEKAASFKVLSDHIRATAFLMADGVMPSNEGRGYVLRRIIRRAVRHAYMLGLRAPGFYKGLSTLSRLMADAYPELERARAASESLLKMEEEKFLETLGKGLDLIDKALPSIPKGGKMPGGEAFKLYDTYGFPLDLTQDVLRGRGISVDMAGFDDAMQEQKRRARAAWKGSGDGEASTLWPEVRDEVGATEFVGYVSDYCQAEIRAILCDGKRVETLHPGENATIILNQTPFYGESGGQQGDKGTLLAESGAAFTVSDAQKAAGNLHLHIGTLTKGELRLGEVVTARIDRDRRDALRRSHTATHLLHDALRKRLGAHVTQKGSLVAEDRLRFDVSHPRSLTKEEIADVENAVNDAILRNFPVSVTVSTPEQAVAAGALALFGEKYGDSVRVVRVGDEAHTASVELCGGTHASRTGDIGQLRIVAEGAVAAGIRRIEAVTGRAALSEARRSDALLEECAAALKTSPRDLPLRIKDISEQKKALEKSLAALKAENALLKTHGAGGEKAGAGVKIGAFSFIAVRLDGADVKQLRQFAADAAKEPTSVAMVGCAQEGKISVVIAVSKDAQDKISASDLANVIKDPIGAKGGGGKADMAQTGGANPDGWEAAIAAIAERLRAA
ncbi:MAG: alanine--tRNA ligase [Rickettsiales bacterium]